MAKKSNLNALAKALKSVIKETSNVSITQTDIRKVLNALPTAVVAMAELGYDTVAIRGLMNFDVKVKPEHDARNPKTGEPVVVPTKMVIKATLSTAVKASVQELDYQAWQDANAALNVEADDSDTEITED